MIFDHPWLRLARPRFYSSSFSIVITFPVNEDSCATIDSVLSKSHSWDPFVHLGENNQNNFQHEVQKRTVGYQERCRLLTKTVLLATWMRNLSFLANQWHPKHFDHLLWPFLEHTQTRRLTHGLKSEVDNKLYDSIRPVQSRGWSLTIV